jgi:hypothetical protein
MGSGILEGKANPLRTASEGVMMNSRNGPRYLMWYDDNPKISLVDKIEDAIAAYTRRFAIAPNIVLINEAEVTEYRGVNIQGVPFVRRNNFWVGFDAGLDMPV